MTANENREDPDAELARTRQHIKEAKEAAGRAIPRDPVVEATRDALKTDPPHHHRDQDSRPSET